MCVGLLYVCEFAHIKLSSSLVYSGKCLLREHLVEHVNKLCGTDSDVDSSAVKRSDQRDNVRVFPRPHFYHFPLRW